MICAAALIMLVNLVFTSFESCASEGYVAESIHAEPSHDTQSGYLNVLINHPTQGHCLYTIFWHLSPVKADSTTDRIGNVQMDIVVNRNEVILRAINTGGTMYYTCYELNYRGSSLLMGSGKVESNYVQLNSLYGGDIIAISMKGNYGEVSTYFGNYVPSVTVIWNDQAESLDKITEILNALHQLNDDLGGKLDTLIEDVKIIVSEVDNVEETLLQIKAEQEESNSWLEKIFNLLENAPEEEKNQAQTQGNQSTSDATTAITDNSQGFIDSLGGLVNSLSNTSTYCQWTFPALYLPEIPGVMARTQLTSEQQIDFNYWVNQIPPNLLLLVQSLLTIGLIIYCFKEVYGTISYVLTLRGGGNE